MDLNSLPRLAWRRLLFSSLTCSDMPAKNAVQTTAMTERERVSQKPLLPQYF